MQAVDLERDIRIIGTSQGAEGSIVIHYTKGLIKELLKEMV